MAGPHRHSRASAGTLVYQRNVSDRSKREPSKNCDTHRAQINSGAFLNKESRPKGLGSDLPMQAAEKTDPFSPISSQHSTIRYQVVENLNRRTAEYRSEKHCLIFLKNFCCSKFLVRYSKYKED
jgi:hypothetical protein